MPNLGEFFEYVRGVEIEFEVAGVSVNQYSVTTCPALRVAGVLEPITAMIG